MFNYNITIFGDSIIKGLCLNNGVIEKVSPNAVELINDYFGIDIDNKSMFGQTLKRLYDKNCIEKYIESLDISKQNIAIIALGGNDADYNWEEVQDTPNAEHTSKTGLIDYHNMMNDIISQLKNNGVEVILLSLCPINARRYFDNILSVKYNGDNIKTFLKNDIENLYRHQEIFNIELMKIAFVNSCQFIDYRTPLLAKNDYLQYMCADGIHPNQQGQRLIADIIINKIKGQLTPMVYRALPQIGFAKYMK